MAERVGGPALALVFNAFVWGISWWPFRELQARGLHPLWATAGVFAVSLLAVMLWRPRAWRAFASQPLLWLLAVACGLTNVGFNWGVSIGDVVRVVLLFYLMPAWAVLLAWPLLGERPDGPKLLRLALALAGVAIVLQEGGSGWPVPRALPDWLALGGGMSFALTNILLRKLARVPSESRMWAMFGGGTAMALASAFAGAAVGVVPGLPAPQSSWMAIALALSLGFLLSNAALQYGAARLAAHATALIMLSEVVFASLSSVALGAAELSARTLAGGALIVAAAAWSAWSARGADGASEAQ